MALAKPKQTKLPKGYTPSADEKFMGVRQKEYFRRLLQTWKDELLHESRATITTMQTDSLAHADAADRASSETDRSLDLRASDRQRKLVAKIDGALRRIEDGIFGYCDETGEPISLARLEARPIATLSLDAQERHEQNERVGR
ncbi:DksA family protein PA5536 (no Zn-finger) [hydrothermal vent metagenome]|uniref:DksA family protein PA5536 (No Zn-finger) n=1 Tax=hydrothermal vent metagenome TaxID=652676 RepID=A0A3B0SA70_9ZZZZ